MISLIIKQSDMIIHREKINTSTTFKSFIFNLLNLIPEKLKESNDVNSIFKNYCNDLAISNFELSGIKEVDMWTKEILSKHIDKERITVEVITDRERSIFHF